MDNTVPSVTEFTRVNLLELFQTALPALQGNFNVYELTPGILTYPAPESLPNPYNIFHPTFFLTNFTEPNISELYPEIVRNVTVLVQSLDLALLDKEPFVGGVVSLCFVVSGIVTASWMLFMLVLLSTNIIPNSLLLANLFHAVGSSVILVKLTNYLQVQVSLNFQDTAQLRKLVYSSTGINVVKSLMMLFIYVSWVDLLVQITRYDHKKKCLTIGLSLSLVTSAFIMAYNCLYTEVSHFTVKFIVIKVINEVLNFTCLVLFTAKILWFTIKKRKFAYHRKCLALALFSIFTLMSPYAFHLIDIISDILRSWCTFATIFSSLCVTITVWEWLHTIKTLERRYERKAVLGRKISNDSFLQVDNKIVSSGTGYILKSSNIVAFFSYLNSKLCGALEALSHALFKKPLRKKSDDERTGAGASIPDNEVMLYELNPSTRNSMQSSPDDQISDNISLVGDYPQFNIDHRFLRNTPSTGYDSRIATPASASGRPPTVN